MRLQEQQLKTKMTHQKQLGNLPARGKGHTGFIVCNFNLEIGQGWQSAKGSNLSLVGKQYDSLIVLISLKV